MKKDSKTKPGIQEHRDRIEAVVLGASAGAIEALSVLLTVLEDDYALPLMIVVHSPPDPPSVVADLFQAKCRVEVKEAEDKEPIRGGVIYFAPANYHMLVEPDRRLSLSVDDPVLFSRPSIDVLFESAADAYGPNLAGVVLTGASSDGAQGLRAVCEAGGLGIVQDPKSAHAAAMPQAAVDACPDACVLSLIQIATVLRDLSRGRSA